MGYHVVYGEDPAWALEQAGDLLKSDPIRCGLIHSLLRLRVQEPRPGRYWVVSWEGEVVGFAFQSPIDFAATATPMSREAAISLANWISDQGIELPAFNAAAMTSAAFAGQWGERNHISVRPTWSGRIYEYLPELSTPLRSIPGRLRWGTDEDIETLTEWLLAFQIEAGEAGNDPSVLANSMIREERVAFWEDHGVVSCAGFRASEGVARIGPVYTPLIFRGNGYGSAVVAGLTASLTAKDFRCMLYTDLSNPVSNSIYFRIGYRPISEVVRFEFS